MREFSRPFGEEPPTIVVVSAQAMKEVNSRPFPITDEVLQLFQSVGSDLWQHRRDGLVGWLCDAFEAPPEVMVAMQSLSNIGKIVRRGLGCV